MEDDLYAPLSKYRFEFALTVKTPDDRKLGIRMLGASEETEATVDYYVRNMASQMKEELKKEGYFDGR